MDPNFKDTKCMYTKSEDFERGTQCLTCHYLCIRSKREEDRFSCAPLQADLFSFIIHAPAQMYHFPCCCIDNLVIKGPCGKLYSKFVSCNLTVSYVVFVLLDCCIILFVSTFLTTDC